MHEGGQRLLQGFCRQNLHLLISSGANSCHTEVADLQVCVTLPFHKLACTAVPVRMVVFSRAEIWLSSVQDIPKTRSLDTHFLASVHFPHRQTPPPPIVLYSLPARSAAEAALYLSPANSVPIHLRDVWYMLYVLVECDKWKTVIVQKLELGIQ